MTAKVHISKMTGKLDGFLAISTNTATNDYCIKQHDKGKQTGISRFFPIAASMTLPGPAVNNGVRPDPALPKSP